MKKMLVARRLVQLLALQCLGMHVTASQTAIVLDFKERTIKKQESLQSLKPGDFFRVEIENVNMDLYKITIGKTDSAVSKAMTIPNFGAFGTKELSDLLSSLSPLGGKAGVAAIMTSGIREERMRALEMQLMSQMSYDRLQARAELHPKTIPDTILVKLKIDSLQEKLKAIGDTLKKVKEHIDGFTRRYNKYIMRAQLQFTGSASQTEPEQVQDEMYVAASAFYQQLVDLDVQASNALREYETGIKSFEKVIAGNKGLQTGDRDLRNGFQMFAVTLSKAQESVSAESTLTYVSAVTAVLNNESRKYVSLPFQLTKERTRLDITISPRKEDSHLQSYSTQLMFPFKQTEMWGVSSGYYVGYMKNEAYSTKMLADSSFSIVNEDPLQIEHGMVALLHYGKKNFQIGFGTAIAIADKIRPRLCVGVGGMRGDTQRILWNLGMLIGHSDAHSKVYPDPSAVYRTRPGDITVSRLRVGLYLSLSYMFYQ